jgi:hypothetical protein
MSTRVSVIGKPGDSGCKNFEGELLVKSLNSLYAFFRGRGELCEIKLSIQTTASRIEMAL